MANRSFSVTVRSPQSAEALWNRLADARTWPEWAAFSHAALEREGSPTPDGVGAIRNFGTAKVVSREEVVLFDAPHHLAYILLSGMPIRDYRADVVLKSVEPGAGGGTDITWSSSFAPKRPGTGWFFQAFLRWFVGRTAKALATAPSRLHT